MLKQVKSLCPTPTKKLFCLLLLMSTTLMIALPASAYAADVTVDNEADLRAEVAAAPPDGTPYTIELTGNIDLTNDPLDILAGTDITLTGGFLLTGAYEESTITVSGTLTLDGITVTHAGGIGQDGVGVYVYPDGSLTLLGGAISGNDAISLGSGGVDNYGTFVMSGGEISGNRSYWTSGGGVSNNGAFTMSGGEISGNSSINGPGGVSNYGTFILSGGTISGNSNTGGSVGGGGVGNNGTFTMSGGTISSNQASTNGGGIRNDSDFTMSGGIVSYNRTVSLSGVGGGVLNAGTFTLEDGTISGNNAGNGGGIYVGGDLGATGTFTMSGGEVSGNRATNGGGIYIFRGSSATMSSGTISGNTASTNGGGVYSFLGTFIMEDGTISNNTATEGGGVDNAEGTFTIMDGTISNNIVTVSGGGVFNGGTFTMEAGAVSGNTATEGGGVFNGNGTFTMEAGAISGNTATDGGGVYNGNGTVVIGGGEISGNTATGDGGGIFTYDYVRLTVAAGAVFSSNTAQAAYNRDPSDDPVYAAQIHGTTWTAPYTQGYNNYDINYTKGSLAAVVTVTFDGNGGTVLPGDESREAIAGEALGANMPPDPTRDDEGLIFKGWNTALDGSGTAFTSSTVVEADITVYAQWDLATAPVTVAFDGNGGTVLPVNETRTLNAGEPLGANMPPDPTWEGHLFTGWNMEPDGSGTAFTSETVLDADTVVYAQWEVLVIAPAPVTVTFDGNGGVVLAGDKARTLDAGGSLGADMPADPTRTRYDFTGWNTAPDGSGTAFTSSTVVDADVTVYAQWAAQGEPAIPPTGDSGTPLPYGLLAICALVAALGLVAWHGAEGRRVAQR